MPANGRWRTWLTSAAGRVPLTSSRRDVPLPPASLASVLIGAGVAVWEYDVPTDRLTWSDEALTLLGFGAEERVVSSSTFLDWVAAPDRDAVRERLTRGREIGAIVQCDLRHRRSDGSELWLHCEGRPELDGRGYPVRYRGLIQDITRRRHVEKALRWLATARTDSRERFFRSLVTYLATAFHVDHALIAETESGWAQTLAVHSFGRLQPDGRYALDGTPLDAVVKGRSCRFDDVRERFRPTAFSERFDVDGFIGVPLLDVAGGTLGVLAVLHRTPFNHLDAAPDVLEAFAVRAAGEIERQQAFEAVTRQTRFLGSVLDTMSDGVVVFNDDGAVVYVNRVAHAVCARAPEPVPPGTSISSFCFDDAAGQRLSTEDGPLARAFRNDPVDGAQLTMHTPLASCPVSISCRPLNTDGRITGIVALFRDRTAEELGRQERTRLEAQVRRTQKLDALGQLASGVAHDFNNMLQVITGFVGVALQELAPGHPATAPLLDATAGAERAAALTRQLLAFGRVSAAVPRVIQLGDLVTGFAGMLRRVIGPGIALDLRLDPAAPLVNVDPGQLEQVLMNLCVNARDAMPAGGTMCLEVVAESPTVVRLTVNDTGTGIAPDIVPQLFEPFFTTKPAGQGTGLGLATCAAIVKDAGGSIDVDSAVGRGTSMHVRLPAWTATD